MSDKERAKAICASLRIGKVETASKLAASWRSLDFRLLSLLREQKHVPGPSANLRAARVSHLCAVSERITVLVSPP